MNGITCTLIGGGAGYYLRATLVLLRLLLVSVEKGFVGLGAKRDKSYSPPDTSASFPNPPSVQELDRSAIDLRKQHGGAKFSYSTDGGREVELDASPKAPSILTRKKQKNHL